MHKSFKYLIPAFMAFTLAACGGSSSSKSESADYSGKTSPASFDSLNEDQKQAVGKDSATVIYEAANFSDADGMIGDFPFAVEANSDAGLHEKVKRTAKKLLAKKQETSSSNLPIGVKYTETENCDDNQGQVTYSMDLNEDTGNGTSTVSYKDCKFDYFDGDYSITNGTVKAVFTENKMRIEFKNFEEKEVWDGKTEISKFSGYYQFSGSAFNYSEDAWVDLDTAEFDVDWDLSGTIYNQPFSSKGSMACTASGCKLGSTVKLEDGKTYKVENFEISTSSSGFSESAKGTIYHPDYGHYTFTATIYEMCDYDEKSPFIGEATFTDSTDKTISYKSTSCDAEPSINL